MQKILLIILLLVFVAFIFTSCFLKGLSFKRSDEAWINSNDATLISASDQCFIYTGRIDFSDPSAPRFDWPGVSIFADFYGSSLGLELTDGSNDYNIVIDDAKPITLSTSKTTSTYVITRSLSSGKHTVLITKRTEAGYGTGIFKGIYVEAGTKAFKPDYSPRLKMEIIGDSLACGYGNEGENVKCTDLRKYENSYMSYGLLAARALNAECSIIAISGKGMVRNYGEKTATSPDPMPLFYDRLLQSSDSKKWDFKSWIPDIVVIALGTNDFSTDPQPDYAVFGGAYKNFVGVVRGNYPKAYILCLGSPMPKKPQLEYIKKIVDELTVSDKKIYYLDLPIVDKQEEFGCDWHPKIPAHKRMADALAAGIKDILHLK